MIKKELQEVLKSEKNKYLKKTFLELSAIKEPITYEGKAGEKKYQIEVQLLEKNNDYVHVSISIDDGKMFRAMFPLSDSFILHKDGRVEA